MNVVYTDVLVIGGGLAGLRIGDRREAARPRRDHPFAGAAEALALRGGAGRHAGEPRQRRSRARATTRTCTSRTPCAAATGAPTRRSCACSSNTAPKAVRELAAWGVPWSRVRKGDREVIINGQKVTITERDEAHGLVAQRDFGGTKKWRTCYVSDGTGHAMLYAMSDQAIAARRSRCTSAPRRSR